jgi:hypothetical protein
VLNSCAVILVLLDPPSALLGQWLSQILWKRAAVVGIALAPALRKSWKKAGVVFPW